MNDPEPNPQPVDEDEVPTLELPVYEEEFRGRHWMFMLFAEDL